MVIVKSNKLNEKQLKVLEEMLTHIKLMRDTVKEEGEDCDLTDGRMGLVSYAEELYLTFVRERKTYL